MNFHLRLCLLREIEILTLKLLPCCKRLEELIAYNTHFMTKARFILHQDEIVLTIFY